MSERKKQAARLRAALSQLKCWGVGTSYRKGKKIMQKVCDGDDQKIVHAGNSNTRYDNDAKKTAAFRAMHKCAEAKRGTAKYLACEYLWPRRGEKAPSRVR